MNCEQMFTMGIKHGYLAANNNISGYWKSVLECELKYMKEKKITFLSDPRAFWKLKQHVLANLKHYSAEKDIIQYVDNMIIDSYSYASLNLGFLYGVWKEQNIY